MADSCTILPGKGLSLIHLNARSIRNKMPQIKTELWNKGIDILCFSETWLTDINPSADFDLDGYNMFRLDRARVMRAGGVCVYVDENYSCDTEMYKHLNRSLIHIEIQWLVVTKGKAKKLLIANIYRPPEGEKAEFINILGGLVAQIVEIERFDVILTGDCNINVLVDDVHKENLYSTLDDYQLRQLITTPTRYAEGGTLIDLMFTNIVHINTSGVANINISDHLPVFAKIKREKYNHSKKSFIGRSYKNYNVVRFKLAFVEADWAEFDECNEVERCWELYYNTLSTILDRDCPVKTFHIKNKDEPWLTPELKTRIAEKNLALKRARRTNSVLDWHTANVLKNRISSACKEAHNVHVVDEVESNEKDSKKFWNAMRKLLPGKKAKPKQINLKNDEGLIITPPETADYINKFFSEIGPKLAEKHTSPWVFDGTIVNEIMPDVDIEEDEVCEVINKLNEGKSSSIDFISTRVFKHSVQSIPEKFIKILKLSLDSGIIPKSWKQAKVTPLPKSGDLSSVSNYRPISQLPIPGKVLERIVHSSISKHLVNCDILLREQGGYRKKCSTIDTISVLTNDILRERNKGGFTLAAFIDIKKAFDSVNYSILIKKLTCYGITGKNLKWIENYFTDRTQVTKCNDNTSNVVDMSCGAPQGSILGPLFFLLYVNDLQANFNNVKTLLYADDTVLYTSGSNLNTLATRLQLALNNYMSWSSKNKLTVNESKTKLMIFTTKPKYNTLPFKDLNIKLNQEKLKFVPSYKYLGVTLDSELNFNQHVKELRKRLAYRAYILAILKQFVPSPIMLRIYKTYTIPLFDYADIVYQGANKDLLDLLQGVQNRCLKYCLKLPMLASTNVIHKRADVPKLIDRRVYHAQVYGFKRSQNIDFVDIRPRVTRLATAPLLKYETIHSAAYGKSIEVSTGQTWNSLDTNFRNLEEISEFKTQMKRILSEKIARYID